MLSLEIFMLKEESIWIKNVLKETDISFVKKILDVGSSTEEFRTKTQPYIDKNIFEPLRKKNKLIYYLDQKNGDGIDLVYDIENVSAEEIGKNFDLVICCSLLEHVRSPAKLASLLTELVNQNGFLLVTVPKAYRYHPDPIDNMFRPSIKEVVSMFTGLQIINKATIRIRDKKKYRRSEFIRYIVPFLNWKVNCLFMKKI